MYKPNSIYSVVLPRRLPAQSVVRVPHPFSLFGCFDNPLSSPSCLRQTCKLLSPRQRREGALSIWLAIEAAVKTYFAVDHATRCKPVYVFLRIHYFLRYCIFLFFLCIVQISLTRSRRGRRTTHTRAHTHTLTSVVANFT